MNDNQLSRFEARVRALVEGSFARLFAGRIQPSEVAHRLAHAMGAHALPRAGGVQAAPAHYVVRLHPDDHAALLARQPALAAILAQHVLALAQEAGLVLDAPPEVELVAVGDVPLHGIAVVADASAPDAEPTHAMAPVADAPRPDRLPEAFLLVDGSRYVPLDRPVINVGRRRDNTIVLDDPRVSRHHAQLRFRQGAFVVYDLGSSGGTYVNGARVTECVLQPGDVIALGGVQVVYVVEDSTTGQLPSGGDTRVGLDRVEDDIT
jgi:hypothetical protein